MPSNLSAFPYIQERSEATPGLWNYPLSVLSANIASLSSTLDLGHFQQLSIGSTPPSYATTAAVTIEVNSAYSDYLYLVDSSGQKSSYIIGSRAGNLADGLNIWDASAGTMIASFSKQSIRFFQNVVGPVFDVGGALADTLNAATFGNGSQSIETRIQAAINQASIDVVSRVYVPANMYPYSASSVSFIDTVQMVREGGNWTVYDVQAYGAAGNGIRDDAAAFLGAVSGASDHGGTVYVPSVKSWYVINSTVTLQDNVVFIGEARGDKTNSPLPSGLSRGTNVPVLAYVGVAQTEGHFVGHKQGLVVKDIACYGGFFTEDLVTLRNAHGIQFHDVRFSRVSGRGLYLEEVNDSHFYRLTMDFCGTSAGTPGIGISYASSTNTMPDTANVLKFADCHFESNKGRFMYIVGGAPSDVSRNSHIWIDRCKFESTTMTHELLNITNAFNVWIDESEFVANNPTKTSTASSILFLQNVQAARVSGWFQVGGSIGTYAKNVNNFIQLSGVSVCEIAAWFRHASTHSIAASAISCSNVSELDITRTAWSQNTYGVPTLEGSPGWFHAPGGYGIEGPFSIASVGLFVTAGTSGATFVGIGTNAPISQLDIVSAGLSTASQGLQLTDLRGTANKAARFKMDQYSSTTEEPVILVRGTSTSVANTISIGGGDGAFNAATALNFYTATDNATVTGTLQVSISSGGTVGFSRPCYVSNDAATTPGWAWSAETQLGFYRSGVSSIGVSKGTFNLATQGVRLSMRTLAASSITASAVNTNVAINEVVFSIGGASGASLIISSGGTAYIFASTSSAILA